MTAEIAILNREAVALAADSAVTIGGTGTQKVFTSANKIFHLSTTAPVGIMVYGSAAIDDVPWETVIKRFREELGSQTFPTLDEYCALFFGFLESQSKLLFPEASQKLHVAVLADAYLRGLRGEVDRRVRQRIEEGETISEARVTEILDEAVAEQHRLVMRSPKAPDVPRGFTTSARERYGDVIAWALNGVLGRHSPTEAARKRLTQIIVNLLIRFPPNHVPPTTSGIVIAGFGTDDMFPRLLEYTVEGVAADFLKGRQEADIVIGSSPDQQRVGIRAFAQGDMIYRFMEGVDRDYQSVVESLIDQILDGYPDVLLQAVGPLDDAAREQLSARLQQAQTVTKKTARAVLATERQRRFSQPVTEVVNSLPKEELAAMAESLVNLTSFKRRISWDDETVGGPVDVAVISKGDGFVWIKRKHYFPSEINANYFARKYGAPKP